MRVRVERPPAKSDLLDLDFEVPASVSTEGGEAFALWLRPHPSEPIVVLRFEELAAAFDARTGRLVWTPPVDGPIADIAFIDGGKEALVLYDYAKHPEGDRKAKRVGLRRFDWATRAPREELFFDDVRLRYPSHAIVVGANETHCLVTSSYTKELAYEVVALERPMRLLEGAGLPRPGNDGPFTSDPPALSPDGRKVACVDAYEAWWENDDVEPVVGRVLVHDLVTNEIESHGVRVTIPEGWQPDDPEAEHWSGLWAPRFLSESALEIMLPDGKDGERHTLSLPLQGSGSPLRLATAWS